MWQSLVIQQQNLHYYYEKRLLILISNKTFLSFKHLERNLVKFVHHVLFNCTIYNTHCYLNMATIMVIVAPNFLTMYCYFILFFYIISVSTTLLEVYNWAFRLTLEVDMKDALLIMNVLWLVTRNLIDISSSQVFFLDYISGDLRFKTLELCEKAEKLNWIQLSVSRLKIPNTS